MTERGKKRAKAPRTARRDGGHAFVPDPSDGPALVTDDFAELLAEDFITAATSGEEHGEDSREAEVPEELGGPFVPSANAEEFAQGTDASNIADAGREPFPMSNRAPSSNYR